MHLAIKQRTILQYLGRSDVRAIGIGLGLVNMVVPCILELHGSENLSLGIVIQTLCCDAFDYSLQRNKIQATISHHLFGS